MAALVADAAGPTSEVAFVKTKLFVITALQPKDEIEEKLEKCHAIVSGLVAGLSDREFHDALNQMVCKGMKEHEDICLGLLFSILTEPAAAPKSYRDLSFISRDGLGLVVNKIFQVVQEKYTKLLDGPKIQILWLLGEMMKSSINGLEPIVHHLLRNIVGGDLSVTNIWLAENLFKLIKANKPWLDSNIGIFQLFIFKYLRTIEDHEGIKFKKLRQMEVEFCAQLIREKFGDCIGIGRDFVRLLQNIFRIPEFQKLWKDILHKPQSLCPQFTGLPQILNVRTSRKFLACLLTPDMEAKLAFLALKVRFGNQKRYQEWFFRQYLSVTENQSLIPDLVRFICGVIHPPNEVLCSEIIPRWAIVGWLYTACQNHVSQANMKLALFYDWLFFQGEKDNIMNIEPAVLLMYNSLRTHQSMTFSLLDFICRITKNYCPQFGQFILQGAVNSWKSALDKRVVSSLSPILKHPGMGKELKQLVAELFPLFVGMERSGSLTDDLPSPKMESPPFSAALDSGAKDFIRAEPAADLPLIEISDTDPDEAVFSDEEDEEKAPPPPPPLPVEDKLEKEEKPVVANNKTAVISKSNATSKVYSKVFKPISSKDDEDDRQVDEGIGSEDVTELEEFQNLDSNLLKDNVLKLKNESDDSSRSEVMEAIISNIESMGDFDDEIASPLCVCLANCLAEDLALPCLPKEINEKSIAVTLEKPQYVIFRSICSLSKNDINLENLYVLLNGIHEVDQKIGYHFLYFLKACYNDIEKFSVYEDYVGYFKDRTLKTVLTDDMKSCYEYDPKLFMYLIESVFKKFPDSAVGNKELIHMLLATIHPDELCYMIGKIVLGQLTVIGENQVGSLIESSLSWTSFEQACLWRFIDAEDIPVEMLVGILPELKTAAHCEAMSNMLLLLKSERPLVDIIKPVLCMDIEGAAGELSLCLMKAWCKEEARELSHSLAQILTKPTAAVKRKLGTSSTRHNPTIEQVVMHLNQLYRHCQLVKDLTLFKYEALRYALTQAKKNIGDADLKTKCKTLFSEFAELPERISRKRVAQRTARGRRGRKKDESSEESESDDEDDDDIEAEEEDEEEEENESDDDSEDESQPGKARLPAKKRRKTSKAVSSDEEDDE